MVSISVGSQTVTLDEFRSGWLLEQLERQTGGRSSVCVRVQIKEQGLDILLETQGCGPRGSGGRRPLPREKEILELWRANHLTEPAWAPGNLIAFIKRLQHAL